MSANSNLLVFMCECSHEYLWCVRLCNDEISQTNKAKIYRITLNEITFATEPRNTNRTQMKW